MAVLSIVFILLICYVSVIFGDDTSLLPAIKYEAEPGKALIRGLIDSNIKRQYYYCPAPSYRCETYYCCPNSTYRCCRDGTCCWPNTYCVIASNGIIGCCPVGKICSGPVGNPTTVHYTYTSTTTTLNTFDIPTRTTTTQRSLFTPNTSTSSSSLTFDTTTTSSSDGLSTDTGPTGQPTTISAPNLTSVATRVDPGNTVFVLIISTFLCIVPGMMLV